MAQYARANTTRRAEGLPVKMHVPGSFGPSNGRQRIVALNSFCTRSSVSRRAVPVGVDELERLRSGLVVLLERGRAP